MDNNPPWSASAGLRAAKSSDASPRSTARWGFRHAKYSTYDMPSGAGAKRQAFRFFWVRLKCTQVSVTEWKHRGNITVIWVILWGTGRYSRKIKKAQTGAAVFRPCLAGVEEVNRISWPNQVSKISETDTASQASHMSKQLSRLHCSAFSYTSRSPVASWEFLVAVDSALHGALSALQSNIHWHKSQRMQKV